MIRTHAPRALALAVAVAAALALPVHAADADPKTNTTPELEKIHVEAATPKKTWPKLRHIMREVDGPKVTVTKKTSITKVEDEPTVIDNNLRQLFSRTPGLLVSEQQSPGQVNLNYRGVGNPQEAEYVHTLFDGMPLAADMIGFPTLYFLPLPQQLSEVQFIRGGNSLLYGPEPGPAINFVSRKPVPDREFAGYTEHVVGSDGLYATFNQVSGTSGEWEYLADVHYRESDGQRKNGDSELRGADLHLGYRPDAAAYWAVDLRASELETGDPGKMSYPQFLANEHKTITPFNRNWIDRYTLALTHTYDFDAKTRLEAKLWGGYQDIAQRSVGAPNAAGVVTTTNGDEQFRFVGFDGRLLHRWGQGNALTVGTTLYQSDAPFRQWTFPGTTAAPNVVDRYQRNGTPRLDQARSSDYAAVFAENVFRWGPWHLVPSVRFEHEVIDIDETVRPPNLVRPLIDRKVSRNVPLAGLGFGNDFGRGNETYFNISQGYRPLRYFDVGSPFQNVAPALEPDTGKSLNIEAGVHGTPLPGFFYDVSVFQQTFKDRLETQVISPTEVHIVNSGDTRHRGAELQADYDFLTARDENSTQHLSVFGSVALLTARFTDSLNPAQVGKTPAFAPHYIARAGIAYREDKHLKLTLSAVSAASQYWSDLNVSSGTGATFIPAKIPQYAVVDFAGDWWVTPNVRVLGGISNLGDRKYYNRVFQNGIEPGRDRTYYAGVSYEF